MDRVFVPQPEAVDFPTEGGMTAHGFFYPPRNPDYVASGGDRPPLIVMSHGGPTSPTSTALEAEIQFRSTPRLSGLNGNYGGNTGSGRPYPERSPQRAGSRHIG